MLAEIIPYGTSFSTEPLTYSVGDSFVSRVKIGQFVEIPYGKKNIFGIIAKISDENNIQNDDFEIKEIAKIISDEPILSETQITMILRISAKYIITLHKILQIFLPSPLISRLEKYYFSENKTIRKTPFENKKNTEKNLQIFLTKNDIITPEKILPFLHQKIVIIFPDDILLLQFQKKFDENPEIREKIFYIFSDATDTKRSQAWIDIFSGKYEIIA